MALDVQVDVGLVPGAALNIVGALLVAALDALVFAIAPLQRAAERLAEKAIPMHDRDHAASSTRASAVPPDDGRALRVYERAVRAALDDGALTPAEEEHLAHIAHDLRIPAPDALRVRRDVERRAPAGAPTEVP